jgi:hypothetical protein
MTKPLHKFCTGCNQEMYLEYFDAYEPLCTFCTPKKGTSTMNGFEAHGIEHLSHSSISSFQADQASWVLNYLFKFRDSSAAMLRGIAVEHGVYEDIVGADDATNAAVKEFNRRTALGNFPDRDKERERVEQMTPVALKAIRKYGELAGYQEKIELTLDDVPVPIIGFTDYTFEPTVVDLKTSGRMPSKMPASHHRQGNIYARATNRPIDFLYVAPPTKANPENVNIYPVENDPQAIEEIRQVAIRINRFLSLSKDKEELAALVVPDYDGFRWSNPAAREEGRRVFGF